MLGHGKFFTLTTAGNLWTYWSGLRLIGGEVTWRLLMAINGRPRHSQSQGLVERGNRTAEQKLQAQKKRSLQGDSYPWASWLPRIMWAMNCQSHETIRDSPYHLVFCKQPPASVFPGAQQNCMAEEDISSDVQINEIYDDLGSDVQHSDNELVPTQP